MSDSDEFAKDFLSHFLAPYGEVKRIKIEPPEPEKVDIFRQEHLEHIEGLKNLDLLLKIAETPFILRRFSAPLDVDGVQDCLGTITKVLVALENKSFQKKNNFREDTIIKMWILTPTVSEDVLSGFGTQNKKDWLPAFHFSPELFHTCIVAIDQLPPTPENLWLRVLGRDKIQQQAMEELEQLEYDNVLRAATLELLYNLRHNLKDQEGLDEEDNRLMDRLETLYKEDRDKAVKKGFEIGFEQGIKEERQKEIKSIILARFGTLDPELERIIEPLSALPPSEFAPLLLQLSRQQLLLRF